MDVRCKYCLEKYNLLVDDVDRSSEGFWCDNCDYFTMFDTAAEETRRFTMILESKTEENQRPVERNRIKLNKRISPLRYPGGKSKIAEHILDRISPDKSDVLYSPYVGGGSVEFALLQAKIVDRLVLNDYDFGVYSLFELIRTFPEALIMEIRNKKPTHEEFLQARTKIKSKYHGCDMFDAAWSLILVNRLAFSGIYKANPLGGIRGCPETLLSRWNPDALCQRIMAIHEMSDRYTVQNIDALEFIEEEYWDHRGTFFIDPPYVQQGKNLYLHYYKESDHVDLAHVIETLHAGFACADLIVTYDDDPLISKLYEFPEFHRIKRKFSA
jgi:DNA adenine methylase